MDKRRPIVSVTLPGRVYRAYRAGEHLDPERPVGTITFEQYLTEQLVAGTLPYADVIRAYNDPRAGKGSTNAFAPGLWFLAVASPRLG